MSPLLPSKIQGLGCMETIPTCNWNVLLFFFSGLFFALGVLLCATKSGSSANQRAERTPVLLIN